jgi:hypothetical protein
MSPRTDPPAPPLRTWRPMAAGTAGNCVVGQLALAVLLAGAGCGPAPAVSDREASAKLVRQIGPALYNYILDSRRVEAQGLAVAQIEKAVEDRFGPRLLRKTRQDDLVVFQSEQVIPDFGIAILAERDGHSLTPSDFGDILIFPKR